MKLLVHICCANCAIYPLERFKALGIEFTGLWFNPNIHPFGEYTLRLNSLKKLSEEWRFQVLYNDRYNMEVFLSEMVRNSGIDIKPEEMENLLFTPSSLYPFTDILEKASRGKRCLYCYRVRLEEVARTATHYGFDAFTTSLLVSPYQGFDLIVRTGREMAEKYNIEFFVEDLRSHYREGIKVSKEMGLYRQKYCGCLFSLVERRNSLDAKRSRGYERSK